jgi:transcriptional regulator GlxA family with amidase domain
VRRVFVVVAPQAEILDVAGPLQVFHEARCLGADYEITLCGPQPGPRCEQGLALADLAPLPQLQSPATRQSPRAMRPARASRDVGDVGAPSAPPDLVVVPGVGMASLPAVDPALVRWLHQAYAAGAHLASVCTGAFLLGLAGLLDGRQCTTHWLYVAELQRRWPAARVLADRLYVTDGRITSSAGIASGIDMALSLVEAHHGPRLAAAVSRVLMVYLRRDGAQQQSSVYLDYRTHLHPGVHRVQDWLVANATRRASLAELASLAAMSSRHLTRVFRQATGISIHGYTTRLRLELAGVLLHDPELTLEAIATRCGFGSARQLRRTWSETFGHPPSRARTAAAEAPAGASPPL